MRQDSGILKQFLGDADFPIDWASEQEKGLFWFFDDLHCPQPLFPMYFDIGGWWRDPSRLGSGRSQRAWSTQFRAGPTSSSRLRTRLCSGP